MDLGQELQIGRSAMDRRRFLKQAAITAGSVPVIMTLTASGALAATCSSLSNRDPLCACTPAGQQAECMAGTACHTQGGSCGGGCTVVVCTTSSPCCCTPKGGTPPVGGAASCCSGVLAGNGKCS